MTTAEFIFAHLSGAFFGVGGLSAVLAWHWMKTAAKSLNEADRFYIDAKAFYEKHAAERLAEAKRVAALASEVPK